MLSTAALKRFCLTNKKLAGQILMNLSLELSSINTGVPISEPRIIVDIKRAHSILFNNSITRTHFISASDLEQIVEYMRCAA